MIKRQVSALSSFTLILAFVLSLTLAQPQPSEAGYLTVADGVEIYYERYGTDTPTVFFANLHEIGISLRSVLENHNVVAWDPRGRGRSSRPDDFSLYGLDYEIADAEAFRQHFGAEQISYIGISLWGSVAAVYAARHPESVAQVVMLGPLPVEARYMGIEGNPPKHDMASEQLKLEQMTEAGVAESDPYAYCQQQYLVEFAGSYYDLANMKNLFEADICQYENDYMHNILPIIIEGIFPSFGDWNWTEEAASIEAQALLIFGEYEGWGLEGVRAWAEHISDVGTMELERAGHHVWNDRADVVLPAIDQFLRGEWPAEAVR